MSQYDFGGAGLAALGRYKIIVPASQTTKQILGPVITVGTAPAVYADGVLAPTAGSTVNRVCRIIIATGTGAVTLYDSDTSGHCDTAHTIWGQGTTVAGTPFVLDTPILLGLWITTAASTTAVVIFS